MEDETNTAAVLAEDFAEQEDSNCFEFEPMESSAGEASLSTFVGNYKKGK
jgi:hypothetical protein